MRLYTNDFPTDAFAPLTIPLFLKFVAVPHIAMTLIAEDTRASVEEAWETMIDSSGYGEAMNCGVDDNSELDMILRKNMFAAKKEWEATRNGIEKNKGVVTV